MGRDIHLVCIQFHMPLLGLIWHCRDRYLTTSTYLSSRAFPSTILSQTPTLHTTPSSYPVLLPGIDALNHARAHPVSWVVSSSPKTSTPASTSTEPHISLVIHTPTAAGSELLNNYGPKPNAELILGYGFSLPNNPDDTIVLKIGGPSGADAPVPADAKFEVGRHARGAEPVWDAVLAAIGAQYGEDEEEDGAMEMDAETAVEDELCAADMLAGMVQSLYDRLPPFPPADVAELRAPVVEMLEHYLEGASTMVACGLAELNWFERFRATRYIAISGCIRAGKGGTRIAACEGRGPRHRRGGR